MFKVLALGLLVVVPATLAKNCDQAQDCQRGKAEWYGGELCRLNSLISGGGSGQCYPCKGYHLDEISRPGACESIWDNNWRVGDVELQFEQLCGSDDPRRSKIFCDEIVRDGKYIL